MKKVFALGLLVASCAAMADSTEVVCAYNDSSNVSPATAVKNLNKKLELSYRSSKNSGGPGGQQARVKWDEMWNEALTA